MARQGNLSLPLILAAHRAQEMVAWLKALLEQQGFTALCASNGRLALQYARQHHPILLLLDQALPLLDGLELCHTLRQEDETAAIFILSDHSDERSRLAAFTAGADACLALPLCPQEVVAHVKAVLRRTKRQATSQQHVLRCGSLELDPEQRQVRVNGEVIRLTVLEYELLSVLLQHPGRAFSRAQLLTQLRHFEQSSPFDRAIDIHVSNLRRKLHQSPGTQVPIETVRGVGYRLSRPVSEAPVEAAATSAQQGQLALAAFDRAPLPLLVLAADRTVILYNEAARRLCGWPADQVVGQVKCYSLLSCHHANGQMLWQEHCVMRAVTLNRLSAQTSHYSITLKDGREVPVRAHYTRLGEPLADNDSLLLTLEPDLPGAHFP